MVWISYLILWATKASHALSMRSSPAVCLWLSALLAGGRIDPAVPEVVPLSEVCRAHERIETGEVHGKLVMSFSE